MAGMKNSKNQEKLDSFIAYCLGHPEERFWQALRNWSGKKFILIGEDEKWMEIDTVRDTFYDE